MRALVEAPPPPPEGDGFWLPVVANQVVPRWCLVALELALAGLAALGLGALATAGGATGRARGAGIVLGVICFALGVVAASAADRAGLVAGAPVLEPGRSVLDPGSVLGRIACTLVGNALVIAGSLGLATRLLARRLRWVGEGRYLALAIGLLLVFGCGLLALGAAELAWIWLVPAAALALAPRVPRGLAPLLIAAAALPAVLVLRPNQLLEAAWNGFWIPGVPIAVWVAVLGAPLVAAVAWWWRSRPAPGPLGTLVLPVGCGVSVIAGCSSWQRSRPSESRFVSWDARIGHRPCITRPLHLMISRGLMTRITVIVTLLFASACDVGSVLANQGGGDGGGGSGSGSGSGSGCADLVTPAPDAHIHTAGGTSNAGMGCMDAAGCHNSGLGLGTNAPAYSYAGTVYTDAGGATPAAGSTVFVTSAGVTKRLLADSAGNFFIDPALFAAPTNQVTTNTQATQLPDDHADGRRPRRRWRQLQRRRHVPRRHARQDPPVALAAAKLAVSRYFFLRTAIRRAYASAATAQI